MSPRPNRSDWWEYHPQAATAYVAGAVAALLAVVGLLLVVLL